MYYLIYCACLGASVDLNIYFVLSGKEISSNQVLMLTLFEGEHTAYETDGDGNRTFSEGEADTSRADDPDSVLSPKKEKKKKVLKTPSFLKKKKKDKKDKEKA